MMNNNKIITISGLSACGKTTLLGKLRDRYGAFLVPSSSSLRDKNKNFQDISDSLEDNIVKQKYYLNWIKESRQLPRMQRMKENWYSVIGTSYLL